ncbi:MAG: addiction module antidote protein [Dongiaceae bacterium]
MAIKTSPFDAAEYLGSDKAIATFVDEALRSADSIYILDALGVVIRAKGMTEIASTAGLARTSLYRDLKASADVDFAAVVRLARALGLRLVVQPIAEEKPKRRARTKAEGGRRKGHLL